MDADDLHQASLDFVTDALYPLVVNMENTLLDAADSDGDAETISVDLDVFICFGIRLTYQGFTKDDLIQMLTERLEDQEEWERSRMVGKGLQ